MTETQAREEICRVGSSLYQRGYVHATAGNISVRLNDGYLITPTDACLGFLDPARLAKVGFSGEQISGDRASKTLVLHRQIYQAAGTYDPATACVIHTHSTHCVALSLRLGVPAAPGPGALPPAELLAALTPYFVMKVGHVPHLAYQRPGAPEAAQAVSAAIHHFGRLGVPIRAVMLERLGPNVWHSNPAQAMAILEELEETAHLALLHAKGGAIDAPQPLSAAQLQELREHFAARW